MRCPFLQEARVKYCQASPFKKMIVESSEPSSPERCSSPAFIDCPSARQEHAEMAGAQQCPNLQSSLMQYCSAASVTKYIPYSESLLSRCGSENHRYCELYLAIAEPEGEQAQSDGSAAKGEDSASEEQCIDGVHVSKRVAYSSNHMWLDVDEDGSCHVGVDAFFAHVLGKIEKLSFITPKGTGRPCAVISTRGVDLPMIFPTPIVVTRANDYLRADPDKLTAHPYSLGWLFEGKVVAGSGANATLLRGKAALEWMRAEVERMSHFIHDRCAVGESAGEPLMMDGGTVRPGLVQHLGQEEILTVFNEFFSF
jgi:glycine cleavage system H lipoate-binding protein